MMKYGGELLREIMVMSLWKEVIITNTSFGKALQLPYMKRMHAFLSYLLHFCVAGLST